MFKRARRIELSAELTPPIFQSKGFPRQLRAKYTHFAQLQVYRSWNKADVSKTLHFDQHNL